MINYERAAFIFFIPKYYPFYGKSFTILQNPLILQMIGSNALNEPHSANALKTNSATERLLQ
jgi:hypothetical protein